MGWVVLDPDEDGYETESDPTPTLDEAPTAGIAKRKREVSTVESLHWFLVRALKPSYYKATTSESKASKKQKE